MTTYSHTAGGTFDDQARLLRNASAEYVDMAVGMLREGLDDVDVTVKLAQGIAGACGIELCSQQFAPVQMLAVLIVDLAHQHIEADKENT